MGNPDNRSKEAGLTGHATPDNVDYNDLKELIKRRTTRSKGEGEAQSIPGAENEARASRNLEDELYIHLKDQHARVDLFVRSKAGEYSRKLGMPYTLLIWRRILVDMLGPAHLVRQISSLERQCFCLGQTKISVRKLEKFSKLEDQTLRYSWLTRFARIADA